MPSKLLRNLPNELRKQKRWVNFRTEKLKNGKIAKIPCDHTGRNVSVKDISGLKTFKKAYSALKEKPALGVGYVFHYDDSTDVHVGIDFDNCVNNIPLFKKVKALINRFECYAEYSYSGDGVHIIGKLAAPYRVNKNKFKVPIKSADATLEIEIYNDKRFFACTGKQLKGFENLPVTAIDEPLEILLGDLNKLTKSKKKHDVDVADEKPTQKQRSPKLTDDEVLGLIAASKQCTSFAALHHNGDLSNHKEDHSRGVMAWHSIIAFYTQRIKQIDRLFRSSALYTDKWVDKEDGGAGKWKRLRKVQHSQILSTLTTFYGLGEARDKYIDLLIDEFGVPRRDIFTEDMFVYHEGRWKNAFGTKIENHLRSLCQKKGEKFRVTHLVPALHRYNHFLKPRFLIDIPTWDGRDRIAEMSECLQFEEEAITSGIYEDLAKDWAARAIQRIYNPRIQNHCMILAGEQGIGKDIFWDTFAGGFLEYQANLTMGRYTSEKDMAEVVVQMAIIIISEFDKLKELGAGVLKDLITKPFFNVRMAYERTAQRYYNRASFLAACNPQQVLTDVTGNRRFWVFRLRGGVHEAIAWDYETGSDTSLQLLSQFKHLSEIDYTASSESLKIMRNITQKYTPEDVNDLILEQFDEAIAQKLVDMHRKSGLFRNTEISFIISDIAKFLGSAPLQVLGVLKANKRHYRYSGLGPGVGNWYGLKEHTQDIALRTKLRKDACRGNSAKSDHSLSLVSDEK